MLSMFPIFLGFSEPSLWLLIFLSFSVPCLWLLIFLSFSDPSLWLLIFPNNFRYFLFVYFRTLDEIFPETIFATLLQSSNSFGDHGQFVFLWLLTPLITIRTQMGLVPCQSGCNIQFANLKAYTKQLRVCRILFFQIHLRFAPVPNCYMSTGTSDPIFKGHHVSGYTWTR